MMQPLLFICCCNFTVDSSWEFSIYYPGVVPPASVNRTKFCSSANAFFNESNSLSDGLIGKTIRVGINPNEDKIFFSQSASFILDGGLLLEIHNEIAKRAQVTFEYVYFESLTSTNARMLAYIPHVDIYANNC